MVKTDLEADLCAFLECWDQGHTFNYIYTSLYRRGDLNITTAFDVTHMHKKCTRALLATLNVCIDFANIKSQQ